MRIYAIHDVIAEAIIGGLHLFANDAAACRMFSDVAGDPKTFVAKRPQDYNLIGLGVLDETAVAIDPVAGGNEVVLSGASWLALHNAAQSQLKLEA